MSMSAPGKLNSFRACSSSEGISIINYSSKSGIYLL
jgi:hypothetical protein